MADFENNELGLVDPADQPASDCFARVLTDAVIAFPEHGVAAADDLLFYVRRARIDSDAADATPEDDFVTFGRTTAVAMSAYYPVMFQRIMEYGKTCKTQEEIEGIQQREAALLYSALVYANEVSGLLSDQDDNVPERLHLYADLYNFLLKSLDAMGRDYKDHDIGKAFHTAAYEIESACYDYVSGLSEDIREGSDLAQSFLAAARERDELAAQIQELMAERDSLGKLDIKGKRALNNRCDKLVAKRRAMNLFEAF